MLIVAVLAVPELTWLADPLTTDDSPIRGGFGLIARGEGVWTVVVVAATVPAAVMVADRRDGLALLLRLRGLGPAGYLALRAGGAGLVASSLAVTGLLVSFTGLVWLLGARPAGPAWAGSAVLTDGSAFQGDAYTIVVAGMAAGGLAAVAAVVGSIVQVPLVPNLVPLTAYVAAAWLESLSPSLLGELAGAASLQLAPATEGALRDAVIPALVWPVAAVVLVAMVGPHQESLWRR